MKLVGFAGYSGSGKTTLVEQLVAGMKARGLRVSVLKHAHHAFDIDQPGKDSWRHRQAGAHEVLVASGQRMALMREFESPGALNLNPAVGRGRGADEAGLWLGASAPRTACPGGASNNARGLKRQTCGRAALSPMR